MYNVTHFIMRALDYGSVQSRPRVYICGVRGDLGQGFTNYKPPGMPPTVNYDASYFQVGSSKRTPPKNNVCQMHFDFAKAAFRDHNRASGEPMVPVVIADMGASNSFVGAQVWGCTCVTAIRSKSLFYWSAMSDADDIFKFRRLGVENLLGLQGWPRSCNKALMRSFGGRDGKMPKGSTLPHAIGNGFHFICIGKIMVQVVEILTGQLGLDLWSTHRVLFGPSFDV